MKHLLFAFFFCIFLAAPAQATSPCVQQTPEQFADVKAASDLIAHVRLSNYKAADGNPHRDDSWTKADVLHVYKGAPAEAVKITGWASYYQPLYTYDKGSEAVLLLKKDGDKWRLTDMNWKSCVPSVIGLPADMDAAQKEEFIAERLGDLD
ncbi:MAG: hypothetical protein Q8K65_01805 [Alphaproteobacteria bacterium]|nr:hypothetical protein [Alphaproteobacteria bacterium]